METYKILRFYAIQSKPTKTIKTGLSLKEAKEHCSKPSTREDGVWFDGYTKE